MHVGRYDQIHILLKKINFLGGLGAGQRDFYAIVLPNPLSLWSYCYNLTFEDIVIAILFWGQIIWITISDKLGLILADNLYIMGAPPVDDANYCLRWNDYEKKYAETFRTLRYTATFSSAVSVHKSSHMIEIN